MTDKTISELDTITGIEIDDAADFFVVVDVSENQTKKITRTEVFAEVGSSGIYREYQTLTELTSATDSFSLDAVVRVRRTDALYVCVGTSGGEVQNSASTPQHFNPLCGPGFPVKPEHFAVNTTPGTTDMTTALNKALQWSADNDVPGESTGVYAITDTLAPGGTYRWDWNSTRLVYTGADVTTLTEALEVPSGETSPQGSGNYVLFDTKGCIEAVNSGRLVIRCSDTNNMTKTSRDNIPSNLIAITSSDNSSEEMTWETLIIIGAGYGFWQGDQRGTGYNILPYTRWTGKYLEIRFCLQAFHAGQSGNTFDEMVWDNVHVTRCERNGLLRSDFVCTSLFLRGLSMNTDKESYTVTESGGTYTTSSPHGLSVGDKVAIAGGSNNLDGSNAIPFVSRVDTVPTTTTFTVEGTPDNAISSADMVINPPSCFVQAGELIALHVYAEGVHDIPVRLSDAGRLWTPDYKVSDGEFGSRLGVGILLTGFTDPCVEIGLNNRASKRNSFMKYLVGVPILLDSGELNTCTVEVTTRNAEDDFTEFEVVGGVSLESDLIETGSAADGLPNGEERNISVRYKGGRQGYQVGKVGSAFKTFKQDVTNLYTLSANLTSDTTVTGMSSTGNFAAPSGGSASKTAGGTGTLHEGISISPGDTIVVDLTATVSTSGFQVCLFDSAGSETGAGDIEVLGPSIRTGTGRAFLTVPAGSGADRVGIRGFASAVGTFTNFTAKKIEAL